MGDQKPKRLTSIVLGLLIVFSVLSAVNIVSMNVLAADPPPWNGGRTIENKTEWYENCNITMFDGNLVIKNNGTLVFNDSVTFEILCDEAGDYGIQIESGGEFKIDSSSANTKIMSDEDNPDRTYSFLNSGTIDFLGATVERVFGDSGNPDTTGGIRNMPGSVCNLTNCNIQDADTHSLYVEGDTSKGAELNIADCVITNTTSNVLDGCGIFIMGNSTAVIDNVTVNNTQEDGIRIINASNATIQDNTTINNSLWCGIYLQDSDDIVIANGTEIQNSNSHGIYLNGSDATIRGAEIHDNEGDGILITDCSGPQVDGGTIELNGRYGIECIDTKNVTIQNATISNNEGQLGIVLDHVEDSRIYGCDINSHPDWAGLYCSHVRSVEISGNMITDNYYGIVMTHGSKNNNITEGNVITDNNQGIVVNGRSDNNMIKNNSLTYNDYNGVGVQNANFNLIQENEIFFNTNGIMLDCANFNNISDNFISGNSANGIYLINSILPVGNSISDDDYTNDTILCKLNQNYDSILSRQMAISNIESNTGGEVINEFKNSGILELEIGSESSIEMTIAALDNMSSVLYAEQNYLVTADNIPNDTYYNLLWGMNNSGQSGGTSDADIDAPEAWDIATGNKTPVIAVIDSGIAYDHPDLKDNMWVNQNETVGDANNDTYPGIGGVDDDYDGLIDEDSEGNEPGDSGYLDDLDNDDDENGYEDDIYGIVAGDYDGDPNDQDGHGTLMAGIIGAIGNNGTGVTGVCWNASMMALKSSSSVSDKITCIEYLLMMKATHGVKVKVISASWSSLEFSQALYDAIDACRVADILFVCSAGNYGGNNDYLWPGQSPKYPASFNLTNIITVAATDDRDELASFSNYGSSSVDVAAPGVNTYSTTTTFTLPNKYSYGYGYDSGTSMATPQVSGLAALISSINPTFSCLELKSLIMNSVDPKEDLSGKVVTEGRINAYNALSYISYGLVILAHSPGNNSGLLPNVTTEIVISISDGVHPVINANVSFSPNSGEGTVLLLDNGIGVDQVAGDGYYSGYWTPSKRCKVAINISAATSNVSTFKVINVFVGGNILRSNIILGNINGIFIAQNSNGILAQNNTISENENGIYVNDMSNYNSIDRNLLFSNTYGINVSHSSPRISNNAIGPGYYPVLNESVYGPTIGGGNDPLFINLDYGDIKNCTLYLNTNDTGWYLLAEGGDYILNYESGEINISAMVWYLEENWTFYSYYNYSEGPGNGYGIWCEYSASTIIANNIFENDQVGVIVNNHQNYSWTPQLEHNQIIGNMGDGIQAFGCNITILNNTISENAGSGLWLENCTGEIFNNTIGNSHTPVSNETVYGPTIGYGNDPSTIYLDHSNISDCLLYLDFCIGWCLLVEDVDYILDYETGEIYIEWYEYFEEGWIFYSYYNYSSGNGQSGIFMNNELNYSMELKLDRNLVSGNLDDGIQAFGCNIAILNNTVYENTGSGVWMENCTGEIFNNSIMQNHHTYGGGVPPEMSGIDLLNCDGVYVGYNNVSENDVNIYLENSRNITIEWNEMVDETQEGYSGGPVPRGIYSVASQMIASNNTIWGTCIGIDIEDADNDTVLADNKFYRVDPLYASTGPQIGIRLINASTILENNLFDGIGYGIRCYENSGAYIHNNSIMNCSNDGINLEWSNATIIGNNISGNGGWGIRSKFAEPTNAGTNGTGLTDDNPLLGENGLGMATQLWQVRVLVWNNTANQSEPNKLVMVNDTYSNPVWQGYTDSQGYTEIIIVSQYEIINATIKWIYTPFQIYTDNSGTPVYVYVNVEGNTIVTVYID